MQQSPEISKFIFWLVTSGAAILVGIVGFFVSYFFKRSMTSTDNLTKSVSRLELSITGMNGIILSHKGELDSLKTENNKDHGRVEIRLNSHSKRLDEHGERIVKLEEKVKTA